MTFQNRPKIELHRHFELSLPHDFLKNLAFRHGLHVEKKKVFEETFLIKEPMEDLASVLNRFLATQKLFSSEQILTEAAFKASEYAFKIENVHLLELRYCPTFIAEGKSLSYEQIHQAILKGVKKAQKTYPKLRVGLLAVIQRILPVKVSERVVDFVIENKDTFLGIDLADNEVGFEPRPFAPMFQKAKNKGLHITVHAGEASVPESSEYVKDSVEYLGAERIGHGVKIIENKGILNWIVKKEIPLEVCFTSNYLTQAFKTYQDHPFKKLLTEGVKVTINSDDPSIFNTDLNKEYEKLTQYQNFKEEDFKVCENNAFEACFIKDKEAFWHHP